MNFPNEHQWHYTDGATSFGPLGSTTIRQLISAGVIASGFHLRRDGDETWRPLADVDLDAPLQPVVPPTAPPPTVPPPPPAAGVAYHLTRNGNSTGPHQVDDLRGMLQRREIANVDLVWKEGMAEWSPVGAIPELSRQAMLPPPPPAASTHGRRNAFQAFFLDVLRHQYADFKGRANRKQYWMFFLFYLVVAFCLGFVEGLLGLGDTLSTIYPLAMFVPMVAISVRRMQDTDHNGWWAFCPVVNLVFSLTEGTRRSNRYGPEPQANVS